MAFLGLCISYFPIAVITSHEQGNAEKKVFNWTSTSRLMSMMTEISHGSRDS